MSMYGIAKRGLGLLGKIKKSTETIKIKPSGKKTKTEKYLKNRKKPTTDDTKKQQEKTKQGLYKMFDQIEKDFNRSKLENIKIVTKKSKK